MGNLKLARVAIFVMLGGYALMILLTALFGRYFPMVGILGLFVALGGYIWAYQQATCSSCKAPLIQGAAGVATMMNIARGKSVRCPACGTRCSAE